MTIIILLLVINIVIIISALIMINNIDPKSFDDIRYIAGELYKVKDVFKNIDGKEWEEKVESVKKEKMNVNVNGGRFIEEFNKLSEERKIQNEMMTDKAIIKTENENIISVSYCLKEEPYEIITLNYNESTGKAIDIWIIGNNDEENSGERIFLQTLNALIESCDRKGDNNAQKILEKMKMKIGDKKRGKAFTSWNDYKIEYEKMKGSWSYEIKNIEIFKNNEKADKEREQAQ